MGVFVTSNTIYKAYSHKTVPHIISTQMVQEQVCRNYGYALCWGEEGSRIKTLNKRLHT